MRKSNCPNCNNGIFVPAPNKHGLITWEGTTENATLNIDNFMPIKVENCSSCGFLKLMYDTGSSQ